MNQWRPWICNNDVAWDDSTSTYLHYKRDALAALLVVHPIWPKEGKDEYIVVVLNAKFCHMELYTGAQDKGLQFLNKFTNDDKDVINAYTIVEAAID